MKTFQGLLSGVGFSAFLILVTTTTGAHLPGDGDAGPAPSSPPVSKPENQSIPHLSAFQESSKRNALQNNRNRQPESRVTITVGEDNGFSYTVNGRTYSPYRIAVSGDYYNDEYNSDGFARLLLVAEPRIIYYAVRERVDRLDVYVQNYYYEEFYFEILTPHPVTGFDLDHGQVNQTAILVTGPSRSDVHGRKHGKSMVTTSARPEAKP